MVLQKAYLNFFHSLSFDQICPLLTDRPNIVIHLLICLSVSLIFSYLKKKKESNKKTKKKNQSDKKKKINKKVKQKAEKINKTNRFYFVRHATS